MHIAILAPYPQDQAPSQRFRFEQYLTYLSENGFYYSFYPFLNEKTWGILYLPGNFWSKLLGIFVGFMKRFSLLFSLKKYHYVLIHREASPIGPPIFEWCIAKILRKKIIYDFDDAIWLYNTSIENKLVGSFKCHKKIEKICRWSNKVSVGNKFLYNFAVKHNTNVILNPTTIDTDKIHNPALYDVKNSEKAEHLVIGWTGTHSTLPYLQLIIPTLKKLELKYNFSFLVIANKPPQLKLKSYKFIYWNKGTEIKDLLKIDIGLMPLNQDVWSKGKCGFKILQYMALEIPSLASPVGANIEIIDNGVDGFLCSNQNEWYDRLEALLLNSSLRKTLGKKGREKVIKHYSVLSNKELFLSLFE